MVVALHNIRSMHNVGSIFRTADAAGIGKLYLCGITPAPTDKLGKLRPQLAKVSLGAEKYIDWEKIGSTARLIDRLRKEEYRVIAVEQHAGSKPYYKVGPSRPTAKTVLVLGNEVNGLPRSILRRADTVIEIPMRGRKESLNVSVAFGIVVFRLIYK